MSHDSPENGSGVDGPFGERTTIERRQFLKVTGASGILASTGLAGCSGLPPRDAGGGEGDGPTDGDPPGTSTEAAASIGAGIPAPYDAWVVPEAYEERVSAITVDLAAVNQLPDERTPGESNQESPALQDPLLALPRAYFVLGLLGAGLRIGGLGLGRLTAEDGPAELLHFAGGGLVLEGAFDPTTIGSTLAEQGLTEDEEYGGYTIFRRSREERVTVVAVAAEAVIIAASGDDIDDPAAIARTLVDAGNGDATPYRETEPAYADLATAFDERMVMSVNYASDGGPFERDGTATPTATGRGGAVDVQQVDLEGEALGVASTMQISGEEVRTAMAIRYASAEAVDDEGDIGDALGGHAESLSVEVQGPMVLVTGTYTDLGETGGTATPTEGTSAGLQGEVTEVAVDGLSVAEHSGSVTEDGSVQTVVRASVENVGDRTTELGNYNYEVTVFDADGNDVTGAGSGLFNSGAVAPGERGTVTVAQAVADGATPARYAFSIDCDVTFEKGAYCE